MALTASGRRRTSLVIQAVVFVGVIATVAALTNWSKVTDSFLAFDKVTPLFPGIITTGLFNTVFYTAIAFAFGLSLGMVLALMKLSSFVPYRWLASVYIEFFRGVPALLVFLALGYGVPNAFGIRWPVWFTVMLSLGLVSAAYIAETLRAGLQAVPKGQMEAARSLGMPHWRAMVTIVIPQAFRVVLPPLTNELIVLTKDTSLVYVLGLTAANYELTKIGRDGLMNLGAGITPVLVAGLLYLVITLPLSFLARWFEKRTSQVSRPRTKRKVTA